MEFLRGAGCQWSREDVELCWAASSGWPALLQYCLEGVRVRAWDMLLRYMSCYGRLECTAKVVFNGYQEYRSQDPKDRPSVAVISYTLGSPNCLECLRLALRESGKPDPQELSTYQAFRCGDEFLRCVFELGAIFDERTINMAVAEGRVEVLQYALAKGAPWTTKTFEFEIMGVAYSAFLKPPPGDSLGCLQCLHKHSRTVASPEACERPSEDAFSGPDWLESLGPSLEVLQYVHDHMGATWADPLLRATAEKLAGLA
eukprot:jgi/Botrbrau1/8816/Bobra.0335s0006.1